MVIVPIFPLEGLNPCEIPAIWSAQYTENGPDELSLVFRKWNNVQYLESFFERNKHDLNLYRKGPITVEEAVKKTRVEAGRLDNSLHKIALTGYEDSSKALQTIFFPLYNHDLRVIELQKTKAKPRPFNGPSWLRLYAIRLGANIFVVTGGAIKLTQTMQERSHTLIELNKMEHVKKYLVDQGISTEADFGSINL
jgi:hypothetical protein